MSFFSVNLCRMMLPYLICDKFLYISAGDRVAFVHNAGFVHKFKQCFTLWRLGTIDVHSAFFLQPNCRVNMLRNIRASSELAK